jgi:hypothetical protein
VLSPDQKQRLLDAVRDMGIDELPEAAAFLMARGEALADVHARQSKESLAGEEGPNDGGDAEQ